MACFHPKTAYLPLDGGRLTFREPVACGVDEYRQISVNCRKCFGCRKARARDWGIRCWHESKMHEFSVAVTLTYDNEHLPFGGQLQPRDVELWMKRLRKALEPERIRFFEVGEFGGLRGRPHYHVLLYGHGFPDRKPRGRSVSGFPLYESKLLTDSWGKGMVAFNDVTLESAMYAAQYALKKLGDDDADDPRAGQEFSRMSRRPGIGRGFMDRYYGDMFRRDWCGVVVPGGKEFPVPDYYLRVLREWCEEDYLAVKERRVAEAALRFAELQADRLAVREECAVAAARFGARLSHRGFA